MKLIKYIFGVLILFAVNASFASENYVKNSLGCNDGSFAKESSIKVDISNKTFEFSQIIAHSDILIGAGYIEVYYVDANLTVIDLFEQGVQVGTLISIENESWSSRLNYKTRKIDSMRCIRD